MRLPPIAEILAGIETGQVRSRELVEGCLAEIAIPEGEGSRTFTQVYADAARRAADAEDACRRSGRPGGPLGGVPVSIKDLFDVAGEATAAGSVVLADAVPARADASVVRRLREAGAVLMGRTNMTEFAYSGLGLNPHYGTPRNPYDRATGRIPGGSSSGAAVSVSDGMAAVAIGSDTGGSVRIPAALCGLTGFKPTARRVPMAGVLPLSPSLDSIGPIGLTVACCARVDAVLAGERFEPLPVPELSSLRLGVLQGYVLEDLDDAVGAAFERALAMLSGAGATIEAIRFASLEAIPACNQMAAPEAFAWHRQLLERDGDRYDPHVATRIRRGATMFAAEYIDLLRFRREIILEAGAAFEGLHAVLSPTTPRIAPSIAQVAASDASYFEANGAMLRNPSVWNYLDGCALSIPCHRVGEAPVGLMVAGLGGWDAGVLRAGAAIEAVLLQ